MPNKEKVDFSQVHIFNSGTFNNIKTTPEHIKDMVAFQQDHANVYADIKLDHIDGKGKRDTEYKVFENFPFSLGTIKNLTTDKDGKKLFGDYINTFEPIKNALKDKLFRTHSAEVFYNVTSKTTGKFYKAVLGAVAILPAGKLPALMEVFKPYMYAEKKESKIINFTDFIEYEEKIVCNLKEEFSMPENDYMGKMKKYREAGMKCKDYSEYMKMDEPARVDYMEYMEKEHQRISNNKKFEMEGVGMPEVKEEKTIVAPVKAEFSMEEVNSAMAKTKQMQADLQNTMNSIKVQAETDAANYKAQLDDILTKQKSDKVNSFVDGLVNSDTPKLLPAQKDKAIFALMSLDQSTKVNYSLDGKEVETTGFDLVMDLLNSYAPIKQEFAEKSIVASSDGIEVSKSELAGGLTSDSVLADKQVSAKYSDKNMDNLSEAELLEIYKNEGLIAN